jgi:uncharacterized protein YbaR (Trm112 family)
MEQFGITASGTEPKSMIDPKFVHLLRCPDDGGQLSIAENQLIEKLNWLINQDDQLVCDRQDQPVETPVDGGLVDESGRWLYPIRMGIPTLIADQAIRIETLRSDS